MLESLSMSRISRYIKSADLANLKAAMQGLANASELRVARARHQELVEQYKILGLTVNHRSRLSLLEAQAWRREQEPPARLTQREERPWAKTANTTGNNPTYDQSGPETLEVINPTPRRLMAQDNWLTNFAVQLIKLGIIPSPPLTPREHEKLQSQCHHLEIDCTPEEFNILQKYY